MQQKPASPLKKNSFPTGAFVFCTGRSSFYFYFVKTNSCAPCTPLLFSFFLHIILNCFQMVRLHILNVPQPFPLIFLFFSHLPRAADCAACKRLKDPQRRKTASLSSSRCRQATQTAPRPAELHSSHSTSLCFTLPLSPRRPFFPLFILLLLLHLLCLQRFLFSS